MKNDKLRVFKVPDLMDVEVPPDSGMKDGDIITIKGYKRLPSGRVQNNCAPGEESKWRAVVITPEVKGYELAFLASPKPEIAMPYSVI